MILNLKRCISLLLVLMLLIGIVPTAFAAEVTPDSTVPEETTSNTEEATTATGDEIDPTEPTEPTDPPEPADPTILSEGTAVDAPAMMSAVDDYGVMNSVMSTVLSKLNAFLDSELEQVICFDGNIDAELFAREKSAIFLILPEEDATKNFVASLMIQNLARELFAVANEHGGKLQNRAVFFCDELGTMPPFDILPLFSAGRSRRLTLVPIIQSLAQLVKNYGAEGAEIIQDNCQDTIFGGFAPNSQTAETLSKNLGCRTVLSGQITKNKDNPSQSLQMMERPLLTADELKSMLYQE